MRRLYPYVGPARLAKLAESGSPRRRVGTAAEAGAWVARQPDFDPRRPLTVTFVVLPDGLWVADRHSEHVACARGRPVLSAGEMALAVDRRRAAAEVVHVTNQSTGYCPEPSSWAAVQDALDAAAIPHPGHFTAEMVFRRCPACGTTNIVKDDWFRCAVCDAELPGECNFDVPPTT